MEEEKKTIEQEQQLEEANGGKGPSCRLMKIFG